MKRHKIKAADVQPEPQRRFYLHVPAERPVPRTVRNPQNPWHEGIHEAKRAGHEASRARCLYGAAHSTERVADVCTDYRVRDRILKERIASNKLKAMYRRWGLDIK